MARRVEWTETALEDVDGAASFIARDSPRYAAVLVRRALSTASLLADLAERGRSVPEFSQPDIREVFVVGYRLIYRLTDDEVQILGFIHGARDLPALWENTERPGSSEMEG